MKNKRFMSLLLCICMVAALFTGFTSTASAADDVITYTVEKGDYLVKICKDHGLDYFQCKNAIMILNSFSSEVALNRIGEGQVLRLPASNAIAQTVKATTTTTTTTTTTAGGTTITTTSTSTASGSNPNLAAAFYLIPHTVKSGETLAGICNAYETSYSQYANMILSMNGITDVKKVWAGKTVYIPTTKAPASGAYYAVVNHKVASGENITSICSNYGISYAGNATLINGLNGKTSMNKILAGQNVYVPVVSSAINNNSNNNNSNNNNNNTSNSGNYQISFNNPAGGNPSATVGNVKNATLANAGDKVVIYPNAKTGYAQQSIKAVRMDSKTNIAITNNAFTMPDADVAVTVTYSKGLEIQTQSSKYGVVDVLVGGSAADSALYGDLVHVVPSPFPGYEVDSVSYVSLDGKVTGTVEADSNGGYWFYMPNRNIKLSVAYKVAVYQTLTGTVSTGAKTGSITFEVDGKAVTKAVKNTTVVAKLNPASGYVLNGVVSITGSKDSKFTKLTDYEYSFVVDKAPVVVTVSFKNAVKYDIAKPENKYGNLRINVQDSVTKQWAYNVEEAKEGDLVQVVATPYTNLSKDYVFKSARVVYRDNSSLVKDITNPADNTFIMPAANVRVEATFEETTTMQYTIYKRAYDNCYFQCMPQNGIGTESYACEAGKTVNIVVTPDANYSVSSVKVYDGSSNEISVSGSGNNYSFVMPSSNANVYVKCTKDVKFVNLQATIYLTGASLDFKVNGQYVTNASIGSRVVLDIHNPDPSKYRIKGVSAAGAPLEADSDGVYSFVITEANYETYKSGSLPVVVDFEEIKATEYNIIYSDPVKGKYWIVVNGTTNFDGKSGKANAGDTIKLVVYTSEIDGGSGKYGLGQIIVDGIEVTNIKIEGSAYVYEFEMPEYDVITKVTFVEKS